MSRRRCLLSASAVANTPLFDDGIGAARRGKAEK